ncbi:protein TANC2-like isoform X3 [Lates japonicus]|uniref:Protein TANC2-like isoform X3 n=1 Tax=Lates japonicus TaxID=270547 RepID=A0AAD3MVW5_LATJO|nr:protein TANC2-like isoform X3 [Lates japonicus]
MFRNSLKMLLGGKSRGSSIEPEGPDVRMMEGFTRSLPSSPLLNLRLGKRTGEDEELGPPPSVDEAADALMTRLGFLLGDKINTGEPGSPYHVQHDEQRISPSSSLASSSTSPSSTLQPPAGGEGNDNKHASSNHASVTSPTSTLESRDSGIIATLTSYSAESAAEQSNSAKYPGDGYHGSSLNLWQQGGRPVVASTSSSCMVATGNAKDSFLYRVDDNMAVSTYSLNKLHPDRGPGVAHSSGSTHSIPLYLMPRPNSVAATSSAHLEDLAYLDEQQRHIPSRTSLRMPRQNSGSCSQQDHRVCFTPSLNLKPLHFEVPGLSSDWLFTGREWLFQEVDACLRRDDPSTSRGVVIVGNMGFGKTAIIARLVALSCHGSRMWPAPPGSQTIPKHVAPVSFSNDSLERGDGGGGGGSCPGTPEMRRRQEEVLRKLAAQVVSYHFCQADNCHTCMVPEFVHNMAAMLSDAPQLLAYRELLHQSPQLQSMLSLRSCIQDPSSALQRGILDPLDALYRERKLHVEGAGLIILIDGLNEAEFHRPDYGDTLTSFLSKNVLKFPSWLKVITTVRTNQQDSTCSLPFHHISLDKMEENSAIDQDLQGYLMQRIHNSVEIQSNVSLSNGRLDNTALTKLVSHLKSLSRGSYLYLKLTLDLIERGYLVLKSSSFKVVPVSLAEVYLLQLNMRFPTQSSFQRVLPLLNITVASLHPLTDQQLFEVVNSGALTGGTLRWAEFVQRLEQLSSFLLRRSDGSWMLNHASFREWLVWREEGQDNRFLCDPRSGHTLLAFWLCRQGGKLNRQQTLELGHHILKAHIYKGLSKKLGVSSSVLQGLWLSYSTENLNPALSSLRNLYTPNIKVSRLLIMGGADVDYRSDVLNNAPLLCVHSHLGHNDAVVLLLDHGAQVDAQSHDGMTALGFAAAAGHLDIVIMLSQHGAKVGHVDSAGQCVLVHAAQQGHLKVLHFLLKHTDWSCTSSCSQRGVSKSQAVQQALIAAASMGHRAAAGSVGCLYAGCCWIKAAVEQGNKRGCGSRSSCEAGVLAGPVTWAMATSKPDILMVLLSKVIQEGDKLYKQGNVREAAHSYQSALQKFPGDELKTFRQLRVCVLLNLSRCRRKMNDFGLAEEFATKALELKAKSYEAFYARARAKRSRRQFHAALEDLIEASRLCPSNREIQRLLSRVKEECRQVAQQQDSPAHSSHHVHQQNVSISEARCRDLVSLQVQDREGLTEEEEEEEKEERRCYREGDPAPHSSSFHPLPVVQSLDTHCHPGVPSSLFSTHVYHSVHSPSSSSPCHSAPPPLSSSSYHHFSPPPSPIEHQKQASPVSESIPAMSGTGGLHHYPQSIPALHHSDQKQGVQQHHYLSDQRSFQKQNPVQGQWLQSAKAQVVRTSQPSSSSHSSMVLGSSAYSQFANLPQELVELGEGICSSPLDFRPSLQVQAGLNSGASYPLDDADVDLVESRPASAHGRGAEGERAGKNRFAQARQFSRNQSKAAYYPMEVTEATMGPPDSPPSLHDYQYHHQGGLRRPLSAHPISASSPRPLMQSVSVRFSTSSGSLASGQPANHDSGFRTSASSQHMDLPSELASVGGVTGYHDDLFLISSPQSEICMLGGGTYPGEVGRSSRSTPFMGVIDKTVRVHQQYPQQAPSSSSSCLSPSRSWAVSSVDTVVTSPSKTPTNQGGFSQPQPSSIAYHNRSNNNAHNGHLLHDNQLDYYEVLPGSDPQGEGSVQVGSHNTSYLDVKLARTLPVIHSCSDRLTERKTGPTSPVKPKRPFVESNV